ncbi:hypothetical protein EV426DRAFT_702229 [Tirmania nivea]|nr:hypothetical protein EV426DRAFT_702229 [Tirmania nivea]
MNDDDDGHGKLPASRPDRVSTPQPPTIIDLSQDDELHDPTYSPRPPKRPPASPHKTTPRRRKLSDSTHRLSPVPWKGLGQTTQTTLNSFIKSPAKKAKTQSTMHSFFGPGGLSSPPRFEAKPNPSCVEPRLPKWTRLDVPAIGTAAPLPAAFRYNSPGDDIERLLQEEMATAMRRSQEARERERPVATISVISIASTPTPPGVSPIAGPSNCKAFSFENGNKASAKIIEEPLLFPRGSRATAMTTATPVSATTPIGSLFFPGGSSSETPVNSVPQRGWESPVKRKFSEIMKSQEPDSLICRLSAHHLPQVQAQALITPDTIVGPFSGKRAKPIQPELQSPPRNALPKIAVPAPRRIKQLPAPISSLRKPIDLTVSPTRTPPTRTLPTRTTPTKLKNAPLAAVKNARDGTDDVPHFEDYDPLSDVEEIRELRCRPTRFPAPSGPAKQGPFTQPPPILQPEGQSMAYQLALAARIATKSKRRPYLSRNARDFLGHIGSWAGFLEFDGCLIHVDFTAREIETIVYHVSESTGAKIHPREPDCEFLARAVRQLLSLGEVIFTSCMRTAAGFLRGRTTNDCILFAKDCLDPHAHSLSGSNGFIRVLLSKKPSYHPPESRQKLRLRRELGWGVDKTSIASEASRQIQHSVIHSVKPWRVFKGGSSDILDVAWSPNGDKFVLGAATFEDVYNRAGNLVLGSVSAGTAKMLHGHQVMRPEPINGMDPIQHTTVSRVGFSPSGILFSAGYDGTVKVWAPEQAGVPKVGERRFDEEVWVLAASPNHHNLVAAGTKNGRLELSSWDDDGTFLSAAPCVLQKTISEVLHPACLAWGSSFHNQYLIAGYDTTNDRSVAGSLVIYDAESGRQFLKVTPGSTRCFDVFSHPSGSFVAGCAARGAKSLGVKSTVRMFHITGTGAEIEFDVDSDQNDINCVTISPCGTYVTSSGTCSTTLLWDVRYPTRILHRLIHGPTLMPYRDPNLPPPDDTGVEVALWGPTHASNYLYTGSSDGVVKVWDVKRADPFVKDLAKVDAQIMSGAWAPGGEMLIVGDTSGTATVLSTFGGDMGGEGGAEQFRVEGEVLPEGGGGGARRGRSGSANVDASELGKYYSRELVRTGKVIVGYGAMGYGAYGA